MRPVNVTAAASSIDAGVGNGLFFPSRHGDRLYGFLHRAERGSAATGVVFVHGAFEERLDAHLIVRDAAERLASRGHAALRFDLFGHGDSDGEFEQATVERWVDDVRAAIDELRRQTGVTDVALVGIRLGASLAASASRAMSEAGETPPSQLALWQPVISGRTYIYDLLRAHLAGEMVMHKRGSAETRDGLVAKLRAGERVALFGYRLAPALFDGIAAMDLAADLAALPSRVLLVDVVRGEQARGVPELATLCQSLGERARVERAVEPQPIHAEGKLFTHRADAVFDATARFIEPPAATA